MGLLCRYVLLIGTVACTNLWPGRLAYFENIAGQSSIIAKPQDDQSPSEDFARQILADAQAQAKTASPVVRAKIWLEFAKQCANDGDHTKERTFLNDAFEATLQIPPLHNNTYWVLQAEILRLLVKDFGPDPLEKLLPRMDENLQGLGVDMLLAQYVDNGDWDKAIETVRHSPKSGWFPFMQAERLMAKLPPQRVADRALIFGLAYQVCDGKHVAVSQLTSMIEKFWRDLPRVQVRDAIPRILKEALRTQTFPVLRKNNAYSNVYDDRKSTLLPILKQLDPARAEQWERGEEAARDEARKAGPMIFIGEKNSQSAVAPPPANPGKPRRASSKPRVVNQCMEDEAWCDENRVLHALESLMNHLKKKELESAKLNEDRGYRLALGEWKLDSDPDDPNQVDKPSWRSTQDWEAFTVLATKISPHYALERVKEIPDPEIQLLTRLMLGRMWLGAKPQWTPCQQLISDYHNEGNCVHYYVYMPREMFQWANY